MPYCMPPDPNTRKPCFTTPANSCDTHFHIFGPPETFPFLSTHEYTPPAAPLEHYLKMTEVIGTQRGVVDAMQTRAELYEYLDYHAYEQKLDELFAKTRD